MNEARLRIAVLDPLIASQLRSHASVGAELVLVWDGAELKDLLLSAPSLRASVIVAEFERLGPDPAGTAKALLKESGAQLLVVAYTFARREDLRRLEVENVRIVRAPVSVDALKLSMMSVLVREIFAKPSVARPESGVIPPRFDAVQLGKLQEITSSIQCECPNHVAATLVSLRAFEDYSLKCIDRDAKDAAVHRMLYERTAAARLVMEEALVELLKHESIDL